MKQCTDIISDIVEIYPIPSTLLEFDIPFNVRCSALAHDQIRIRHTSEPLTLEWLRTQPGMIQSTLASASTHARTIIIEEGASVKATMKRSVAGTYYQVIISAKAIAETSEVEAMVEELNRTDSLEVIIVDSSEALYVIRGADDAHEANLTVELPLSAESTIEITSESVSGILPLSPK